MEIRQVLNTDLGCASYLIADREAGVAAVVDPKVDIDDYLALENELGVRITDVIETHNHADHVSGRPQLVELRSAAVHIHGLADPEYDHVPFADGDVIEVGAVRLRVLHTPGHRPEHSAIEVLDGSDVVAVMTGDSLFVGDVARPDLAVDPREGAHALYQSMRRLAALDGEVTVYPAHIGGSLCGTARMSSDTSSTIAAELRTNLMFRTTDEHAFVDALTTGLAPKPPNFQRIVARNQAAVPPPSTGLPRVAVRDLAERMAGGAVVIDGRAPAAFDAAHIPGSLSVNAAATGFATRAAWMTGPDAEVILVADDEPTAELMARELAAVAVDGTAVLAGGFRAFAEAGLPVVQIATTDVAGLHARLGDGDLQVVDVREPDEWAAGHIPGARNIPFHQIPLLADQLDPARPVAVICTGGTRSGLAASALQRAGLEPLHVMGGMQHWDEAGYASEVA